MTALIIKALSAMTNPLPDTPTFPDIESGMYFDLDARTLDLQDGETVSSWSGKGPAPLANRTLNTAASASIWTLPTYSATGGPDGTPAIAFDGINQRIRTTDSSVTPYSGGFTVVIVGKGSPGTDVSTGRIYSSAYDAIYLNTAGNIVIQQDNKTYLTRPNSGGHFVAIISASGSRLLTMVSGMAAPSEVNVTNPSGYSGFGLGASGSAVLGSQVNGSVSRVTTFSRALTAVDVTALMQSYREEYGI